MGRIEEMKVEMDFLMDEMGWWWVEENIIMERDGDEILVVDFFNKEWWWKPNFGGRKQMNRGLNKGNEEDASLWMEYFNVMRCGVVEDDE